jgi:hypothetical protein
MAPIPSTKLNPLWWEVFVTEYLKNGQNASAAYRIAKPHVKQQTAEVDSTKLLRNPKFVAFLNGVQSKLAAKFEMSRERWLQLIADCAEFDIRDYLKLESGSGDVQLVDDWKEKSNGHAIAEVQFSTTTLESGAVVQRVKLTRESKLKALDMIGRALGYVTDSVEHKHSGSLAVTFSDETQDEIARDFDRLRSEHPIFKGVLPNG